MNESFEASLLTLSLIHSFLDLDRVKLVLNLISIQPFSEFFSFFSCHESLFSSFKILSGSIQKEGAKDVFFGTRSGLFGTLRLEPPCFYCSHFESLEQSSRMEYSFKDRAHHETRLRDTDKRAS